MDGSALWPELWYFWAAKSMKYLVCTLVSRILNVLAKAAQATGKSKWWHLQRPVKVCECLHGKHLNPVLIIHVSLRRGATSRKRDGSVKEKEETECLSCYNGKIKDGTKKFSWKTKWCHIKVYLNSLYLVPKVIWRAWFCSLWEMDFFQKSSISVTQGCDKQQIFFFSFSWFLTGKLSCVMLLLTEWIIKRA